MSFTKTLKIEFKDGFAYKKMFETNGVELIEEINSKSSHNSDLKKDCFTCYAKCGVNVENKCMLKTTKFCERRISNPS